MATITARAPHQIAIPHELLDDAKFDPVGFFSGLVDVKYGGQPAAGAVRKKHPREFNANQSAGV
jgi:hypothetical protein